MSDVEYLLSTSQVSSKERFAYWRDAISDAFVPLEPERPAPEGFCGSINGLLLPDLHVSTVAADAHRVRLSRGGRSRQTRAPFFVNLLLGGEAVASQHGQADLVTPGDVYVLDCDKEWEVDFRSRFSIFCIEIDADLLRPRLGCRGRLDSPVLRGDSGPGRVLSRYLHLVRELPPADLRQMYGLMVGHCTELLGRACSEAVVAEDPATRVREQNLQRILNFIESRLKDPTLSPADACADLHMSRSYLFKVLSQAGLSFAAHVRQRRLHECRQSLLQAPTIPVLDIAMAWGFEDAPAFSRAYRQRFGESPSQSRQHSARTLPTDSRRSAFN